MEWIIEFREQAQVRLTAARAEEIRLREISEEAAAAAYSARLIREDHARLVRALDQIDPMTRSSEPPL